MNYFSEPIEGIAKAPVPKITNEYLCSFPRLTIVTDDNVRRDGWDLTNVEMPKMLYWQDGETFVWVMKMLAKGQTSLDMKKTNSQGFKFGDFRVWPESLPLEKRTLNEGWIVKRQAYEKTYEEVEQTGFPIYRKARKVGKVRALLIPEPFFALTLDSDKPFWYDGGSILVQQVDREGNTFVVDDKRDMYAMTPEKFCRYVHWCVG